MYKWLTVGWCVGKIVRRNLDDKQSLQSCKVQEHRRPAGQKVNFIIFYELDDESVKTVLQLAAYGGDEVGSWMLLAPTTAAPAATAPAAAGEL